MGRGTSNWSSWTIYFLSLGSCNQCTIKKPYLGAAKCIISTAQHANPKVIGHNELCQTKLVYKCRNSSRWIQTKIIDSKFALMWRELHINKSRLNLRSDNSAQGYKKTQVHGSELVTFLKTHRSAVSSCIL